jgi:hypothetical protein
VEKEICTLKGEAVNLLSNEEKEERNHLSNEERELPNPKGEPVG